MPNLTVLRDFIQKTPLPASQKRERTFLDISGFPHYELVISNWYAYFLSNTEDHGLGNTLLASLIELVNEKSQFQFTLEEYTVATEVSTKNLKRIDILIAGIGMDSGKFVILENKVYHWLHNDLKEYWDHCPTHESNKIGIVLTLTPTTIAPFQENQFINILHSELLGRFQKKLINSTSKYLPDFINSIKNLYKDYKMNEEIQFYFQNLEACNRIYDMGDKAYEYITEQVRITGEKLGLKNDRKGDYYRCLYDPLAQSVYYTITFESVFEEKKSIFIIIELWKEALNHLPEIEQQISSKAQSRGLTLGIREHKGLWKHFAYKEYPIELNDLNNLATVVENSIKNDLETTYLDIKNILQQYAQQEVHP